MGYSGNEEVNSLKGGCPIGGSGPHPEREAVGVE